MVLGIIGGVRDWKSIIDRVGMKLFCIYFTRLREFSEFNCIFACPTLIPLFVEGVVGAHIYIKGVTVRFGFDCVRTSQLQTVCQKQSNGNASWDVYIQPSLVVCVYDLYGELYTHQRGAFGVARFDRHGNAKALTQWNE